MKVYLFFIITLVVGACSTEVVENNYSGEKISRTIEYNVDIGDPVDEYYDDNWLPKKQRLNFLQSILGKAKNGELPVYEFFPDTLIPLSQKDVARIFKRVELEAIENENGNIEEVAIENELDIDGITKLKFREDWYFNEAELKFEKQVIGICPMEKIFAESGDIKGYKGLFWIYLK